MNVYYLSLSLRYKIDQCESFEMNLQLILSFGFLIRFFLNYSSRVQFRDGLINSTLEILPLDIHPHRSKCVTLKTGFWAWNRRSLSTIELLPMLKGKGHRAGETRVSAVAHMGLFCKQQERNWEHSFKKE